MSKHAPDDRRLDLCALAGTTQRRSRPRPILAGSASGSCRRTSNFTLLVNGEAVEPSWQRLDLYRVEQVDGPSLLLKARNARAKRLGHGRRGRARSSKPSNSSPSRSRPNPTDAFFHAGPGVALADRQGL